MPDQRLPDQRLPDPRLSRTRFLRPGRLRLAVAALSVATVGAIAPLAATPASAWTTYSTDLIVRATDSGGGQFAGGTGSAELSEDGNWLAFSRLSTNGSFVKSLVSGKTELISVNDAEQPANPAAVKPGESVLSDDGRYVSYATTTNHVYARNVTSNRVSPVPDSGMGSHALHQLLPPRPRPDRLPRPRFGPGRLRVRRRG
jgi:hypothetical protein